MNGTFRHVFVLLCLVCWPGLARANAQLSYTARLTAGDGAPLIGPVSLEVRFFDAVTGGNQLGQTLVFPNQSLAEGIAQLTLSLDAASADAILSNQTPYVEVKNIAGRTYPRQRFHPVPFALRVPVAPSLAFDQATGQLGIAQQGAADGQVLTWSAGEWKPMASGSGALNLSGQLTVPDGSFAAPEIKWAGGQTGLFRGSDG